MNTIWLNWAKNFPVHNFSPNDIILEPGKKPQQVYAIAEGIVKMYDSEDGGNQILLSLFTEGSIIPMPAAILKRTNNYTFEAHGKVRAYAIPADDFFQHLRKNPDLKEDVLATFLKAFLVLTEQVSALKFNRAEEKINVILKQLKIKSMNSQEDSLVQRLTQQEIADLAGVSRETVSRKLGHHHKTL